MKSILKVLIISCFCVFFNSIIQAQERPLEIESIQTITASRGVIMYSTPKTKSKQIAIIPFQENILVLNNPKDKKERLEGVEGYWRQAYYKNEFGYVFDAYLKIEYEEAVSNFIYQPYYVVYKTEGTLQELLDKPNENNAKPLVSINEGELVLLLDNSIEGKEWVKVRYKNYIGYLRGANLISHEAYPFYWETLEDIEAGD